MAADAQPLVTAADVQLPATAGGIRRLAVTVAVDPPTVAADRTAAVDRTAVDMGGDIDIALGLFPA
jgi:hypothetical protein